MNQIELNPVLELYSSILICCRHNLKHRFADCVVLWSMKSIVFYWDTVHLSTTFLFEGKSFQKSERPSAAWRIEHSLYSTLNKIFPSCQPSWHFIMFSFLHAARHLSTTRHQYGNLKIPADSKLLQQPVSIQDVHDAAKRIQNYVHKTPVMTSQRLNKLAGRNLFFKCELLQKTGSFKVMFCIEKVI